MVREKHARHIACALRIGQWAAYGLACWLVVDGVFMNASLPSPTFAAPANERRATSEAADGITLEDAAVVWRRDLRQTLIEPPKKEEKPPAEPPPPPPVQLPRLVATFVERGQSWGIFVSSKSGQVVRPESAQLDGFTIVAIRPGEAVLMQRDREYTVEIPKKKVERQGKRRSRRRGH